MSLNNNVLPLTNGHNIQSHSKSPNQAKLTDFCGGFKMILWVSDGNLQHKIIKQTHCLYYLSNRSSCVIEEENEDFNLPTF